MKNLLIIASLVGAALPAGVPGALLPAGPGSAEEKNYKLVKVEGQVALYERWLEVEAGREAREMKAEFTVPVGPEAVVALLRNEAKTPVWMRRAASCRIMLEGSGQSWLAYVRYNIPWPISDQDCLLRYEVKKNENRRLINFRSASDSKAPPMPKVKRMQGISGAWLLEPLPGNKTKITYTVMTTEKPSLPRWATDPVVQGNLLDTMNAFCTLLAS